MRFSWRYAIDLAVGLAGLVLCASSLQIQRLSPAAMEYLVIAAPVIVFPLLTFVRVRRSPNPLITYVLVSAPAIAVYAGLVFLAHTTIAPFLLPLMATLVAGFVVATAFRFSLAAIAVACATIAFAVPSIWNRALARDVKIVAPDVALDVQGGRPIRLSELRGRVVVLNFWGVWCGPCVRELPELDAAARAVAASSDPARIFAVNSGIGGEDRTSIDRFLAARHMTVPVVYDLRKTAYRAFGIHGLPTTVVIGPDGLIRRVRVGFASTANFEQWIRSTIRELAH